MPEAPDRLRQQAARYPRRTAALVAIACGTPISVLLTGFLMIVAEGDFALAFLKLEMPVFVASALAWLSFGRSAHRRSIRDLWLFVAKGVGCALLSMVIVGGTLVLYRRVGRALDDGLRHGVVAFMAALFSGATGGEIVSDLWHGIVVIVEIGSLMTLGLPEILGAVGGYLIWRATSLDDGFEKGEVQ